MKKLYAVTFSFQGRTMYAIRGIKPSGLFQPEPRCIFSDEKVAKQLLKFMQEQSTFKDIRLEVRNAG